MKKNALFFMVLTLLLCGLGGTGKAAEPEKSATDRVGSTSEVIYLPVITLNDWKQSTYAERMGFLAGFLSALDLEKEWQGKKPLPLEKSLNYSWIKGFAGVSMTEIADTTNAYVAKHPEDLNRPLVEYLWYAYAQPKVTEKLSTAKQQQGKAMQQRRNPPVIK